MGSDPLEAAGKVAFDLLFPGSTILSLLGAQSKKAMEENASRATLQEMADRQEIQLRMSEAQAKIAQELAIAWKIQHAEEVEIEEFYEYVGGGGGSIGGNVNSGEVGISANGEIRRVSRRVYKFRSVADVSEVPQLTHS